MRQKLLIFLGLLGLLSSGAPSLAFAEPLETLQKHESAIPILAFCIFISFILNFTAFLNGKSRYKVAKSDFYVLFGDFWFNEFYMRRLTTFVYFLYCWTFWSVSSYLVLSFLICEFPEGASNHSFAVYSLALLACVVFIIFARISLELSIVLIKIAENTRQDEISTPDEIISDHKWQQKDLEKW